MGQRNVGREIALSLGAAVLFGGGLAAYLMHEIPSKEELTANGLVQDPVPESKRGPDDLELAGAVVEGFGAELAGKKYDAAYARMAEPYRRAFALPEFQAACERSPFLSAAQRMGLLRTRRMSLGGNSDPALPVTVRGEGVLVTGAGSIDVNVTLLVSGASARILVLSLGGIPVLDGVSGTGR